ncbi:origin recognition complex subunit 2, putative [Eimeria praecox]|uniref:Origin recognition complex subunit 2 n=1 Tax=Eimeria praecox TaxID=51316 RepID=U6GU33_9EIME|nr:origin recognition complex subunit 2, putative [Eimeria praecox]
MAPAANPSANSSEVAAFEEGDAAWLVRQFGRFKPLLQREAACNGSLRLALPVELGVLGTSAKSNASCFRDADRARRLLQWSNRQHKERLLHLQRLSTAHTRRPRVGTRGQKRKRRRGCELGAESSSSSSSSSGEDGPEEGRSASPLLGDKQYESNAFNPEAAAAASVREASLQMDDESPVLLAAYDMLFCASIRAGNEDASLPISLLSFISEGNRLQMSRNAGQNSRRPKVDTQTDRAAHPGRDRMGKHEPPHEAHADASQSEVLGDSELHPIRQLQESVLNLPEQNGPIKECVMREQLQLLGVRWKCLLMSGWNILVAGCGSKGHLLREFATSLLSDGFCCVLNAYQREFKLHQALQAAVQVVRSHLRTQTKYTAAAAATIAAAQPAGGSSASSERLVKELKALLRQCAHPLYLVVIGFDSSNLTDGRRHLAALASCDKAILLDAAELRDFRFVFETAHTRRDYREEVLSQWGSMCGFVPGWLWEASRVQGSGGSGNSVNFEVVMRGLTTNHKRLLRCIAEMQLAQIERNESPIVSLADLGTEASGVSMSLTKLKLKELLVEVTSHGAAVQAKKNGQEAIAIRANKTQLQELLQLLDKAGL